MELPSSFIFLMAASPLISLSFAAYSACRGLSAAGASCFGAALFSSAVGVSCAAIAASSGTADFRLFQTFLWSPTLMKSTAFFARMSGSRALMMSAKRACWAPAPPTVSR